MDKKFILKSTGWHEVFSPFTNTLFEWMEKVQAVEAYTLIFDATFYPSSFTIQLYWNEAREGYAAFAELNMMHRFLLMQRRTGYSFSQDWLPDQPWKKLDPVYCDDFQRILQVSDFWNPCYSVSTPRMGMDGSTTYLTGMRKAQGDTYYREARQWSLRLGDPILPLVDKLVRLFSEYPEIEAFLEHQAETAIQVENQRRVERAERKKREALAREEQEFKKPAQLKDKTPLQTFETPNGKIELYENCTILAYIRSRKPLTLETWTDESAQIIFERQSEKLKNSSRP